MVTILTPHKTAPTKRVSQLAPKTRDILHAIQLRRNRSVQELSQDLGFPAHVVRHGIDSLVKAKLIAPSVIVNFSKLGITSYSITIRLEPLAPTARSRFIKFLRESPRVSWVAEVEGSFDFELTFLSVSSHDLELFLDSLSDHTNGAIREHAFSIEHDMWFYGAKFIASRSPYGSGPLILKAGSQVEVADSDFPILWALSNLGYSSYASLAHQLDIPSTTLHDRLRKLRTSGVICAEVFLLNPVALGADTFHAFLKVRRRKPEFLAALQTFCEQSARVEMLIRCVGNWDVELLIYAENSSAANDTMAHLGTTLGEFVSSLHVLRRGSIVKANPFPCRERFMPAYTSLTSKAAND